MLGGEPMPERRLARPVAREWRTASDLVEPRLLRGRRIDRDSECPALDRLAAQARIGNGGLERVLDLPPAPGIHPPGEALHLVDVPSAVGLDEHVNATVATVGSPEQGEGMVLAEENGHDYAVSPLATASADSLPRPA
jgi:hypothetical protein